jgi:hypothetical protein
MANLTSLIPRQFNEFGPTSIAAANAVLFDVDTSMYDYGTLQIKGTFVGSIIIEGSNDDFATVNVIPYTVLSATVVLPSSAALTAASFVAFGTSCKRIRARCSAYTSGSIVGIGGFGVGTAPLFNKGTALVAGTALIGSTVPAVSATVGSVTLNHSFRSAAGTNVALILTGARKLIGYTFQNTTATAAYVKLYNKATAPVVASDIPFLPPILVPANGASPVYFNDFGKAFSLGLGIACTNLIANTDATATTVDQIIGHIDYI